MGCLQPNLASCMAQGGRDGAVYPTTVGSGCTEKHDYVGRRFIRVNLWESGLVEPGLHLQHPSPITMCNFLPLPLPSATGRRRGGTLMPEGMLTTFMPPPKGPWWLPISLPDWLNTTCFPSLSLTSLLTPPTPTNTNWGEREHSWSFSGPDTEDKGDCNAERWKEWARASNTNCRYLLTVRMFLYI